MFSTNKSNCKSNTNINKRKNSAALAAKKDSIDFLCIENSRLNFISTDLSFSRLYVAFLQNYPLHKCFLQNLYSQLGD